jgi:hypothetical protein
MRTAGVFGTHAAAAFALGSPEARCTVAVRALVHTRTPVAVRGPCLVTTAAILVAHIFDLTRQRQLLGVKSPNCFE